MARKRFSAAEMLARGQQRTAPDEASPPAAPAAPPAGPAATPPTGERYRRVTVFITPEQYRWVRQVALQAQMEECALSASDVVRLALERLRETDAASLRQALVEQAWRDLQRYPGRAKRGMPARGDTRG
jgi:hypothetical protein